MTPRNLMATVAAAALVAVAGCAAPADTGASPAPSATMAAGPRPAEILAGAQAAVMRTPSVRLRGRYRLDRETIDADLTYRESGTSGHLVEIVSQVSAGGARTIRIRLSLRRVGGRVYQRISRKDWHRLVPRARVDLGDRWFRMRADEPGYGFTRAVLTRNSVADLLVPSGKLSVVPGKQVAGHPTVGLRDDDPHGFGTVYVATDGRPLPLLLVGHHGRRITLDSWDTTGTVLAPPGAADLRAVIRAGLIRAGTA